MKRILLTTYPHAFLHHGGGEREIHLLQEALNLSGMQVDIYGPNSRPIHNYQIVIHFSMINGSEHILNEAEQNFDQKLILWPNLWLVEKPSASHLTALRNLLSKFDAVVFKSLSEEKHFRNYFDLTSKDIINITPLVSPKFHRNNVSTVFKDSYGLSKYALWTGIIEPQKNQMIAIQAFNNLDIDLVISGEERDKSYANECKNIAKSNIHFIPSMPFASELHLSALRHCSLYIELPIDFPGTSAIEAQSMGCKLLLSRSTWTEEMFGDSAVLVEANDKHKIRTEALNILAHADIEPYEHIPNVVPDNLFPLIDYLSK